MVKLQSQSGGGNPVLMRIANAALAAVQPHELLKGVLRPSPLGSLRLRTPLWAADLAYRRLFVVAIGKAAPGMAAAAAEFLSLPFIGVGVSPTGSISTLKGWRWLQGDHPLPAWRSVIAAIMVRDTLLEARREDVVLVLLSGGSSSLATLPTRGHHLSDLRLETRLLLRAGGSIHQLNAFRRRTDHLKAGGLARFASPARTVGLLLSDVPGNAMWAIGSGPTIAHGPRGEAQRTPGRDHPDPPTAGNVRHPFPAALNLIIGSNETALTAAAECARRDGFRVETRPGALRGEARAVGTRLAEEACSRAGAGERCVIVLGGETSVTVQGAGVGGRNTEMALAFAIEAGRHPVCLMTLATDGKDGCSPAAGGLVDGTTVETGLARGQDPWRALATNDSYTFLSHADATMTTGPTGTNVADLAVVILNP